MSIDSIRRNFDDHHGTDHTDADDENGHDDGGDNDFGGDDGTTHGTRQRTAAEEASAAFAASKSEKLHISRNHYYELHHIADEAGNDQTEFARRWQILEDGLLAIKMKMPSAVGGGSARATHTSTDILRQQQRKRSTRTAARPVAPAFAPAATPSTTIVINSGSEYEEAPHERNIHWNAYTRRMEYRSEQSSSDESD